MEYEWLNLSYPNLPREEEIFRSGGFIESFVDDSTAVGHHLKGYATTVLRKNSRGDYQAVSNIPLTSELTPLAGSGDYFAVGDQLWLTAERGAAQVRVPATRPQI